MKIGITIGVVYGGMNNHVGITNNHEVGITISILLV